MYISIAERENNQYREGHVVSIGRTGKLTCPVAMTEHFISKAQCSNEDFLTCSLVRCKNGLRAIASGISYTRVLEILRLGVKPILGDDFNFGSHSLRSGAATVAMANGLAGYAIDEYAG